MNSLLQPYRSAESSSVRFCAAEYTKRFNFCWILIAIPLLVGPTLPATAVGEVLEESQFVDLWIEALQKAGLPTVFEPGEGVEIFGVEGGARTFHFIGQRTYEEYLRDPSTKDRQLSLLVGVVLRAVESRGRAPTLSKLVPLLRSRSWLEEAGVSNIPVVRLPGGPVILIAEDEGTSIRHLRRQDLAMLDRPLDELVSIAVANLPSIAPVQQHDLGSVLMLTSGGTYEASLILDRELISSLADQLGGEVIFSIPMIDVFLVGRRGQAALEGLARGIGRHMLGGGEILSRSIYSYRDGKLIVIAHVEVIEGRIRLIMAGEN